MTIGTFIPVPPKTTNTTSYLFYHYFKNHLLFLQRYLVSKTLRKFRINLINGSTHFLHCVSRCIFCKKPQHCSRRTQRSRHRIKMTNGKQFNGKFKRQGESLLFFHSELVRNSLVVGNVDPQYSDQDRGIRLLKPFSG